MMSSKTQMSPGTGQVHNKSLLPERMDFRLVPLLHYSWLLLTRSQQQRPECSFENINQMSLLCLQFSRDFLIILELMQTPMHGFAKPSAISLLHLTPPGHCCLHFQHSPFSRPESPKPFSPLETYSSIFWPDMCFLSSSARGGGLPPSHPLCHR